MMKSIALLDSVPQDEDFVLVGGMFSDFDPCDDDDIFLGENDSYDYCEDVSLSSNHQTITSTSNPLQIVRENFFSGIPAQPVPVVNSFGSSVSLDHTTGGDVDLGISDMENDEQDDSPNRDHRYVESRRGKTNSILDQNAPEVSFSALTITDSFHRPTEHDHANLLLPAIPHESETGEFPFNPLLGLELRRASFSSNALSRGSASLGILS